MTRVYECELTVSALGFAILRLIHINATRLALCAHYFNMYVRVCLCVQQQDSCGEEERPSLVTVVKPTAKPRRARLLSKGRKLNNKKRGRPKKAAPAAEKKNKKNQSALDLLHAKTLSAAPPQGQRTRNKTVLPFLNKPIDLKQPFITEKIISSLRLYCLAQKLT